MFSGSQRPLRAYHYRLGWQKRRRRRRSGNVTRKCIVNENDNVASPTRHIYIYITAYRLRIAIGAARAAQAFLPYAKFPRESQVFELIRELERIVNSFHLISLSCYVALLNQECAWRTNVRGKSECSKILAGDFRDDFKDKISNKGRRFNFFSLLIYLYIYIISL